MTSGRAAPETSRLVSNSRECLLVAPPFQSKLREAGLDQRAVIDRALEAARSVGGGRGPNQILEIPGIPPIRVRPFRHGGLFGPLLGDRFVRRGRSEREFRIWQGLSAGGAPVPPVVFALARRRGLFWRERLGAINLEGAIDLTRWLRNLTPSIERGEPGARQRLERVAIEVGRAVRIFHECGAVHGDLHLGNLLIEETPASPRIWLVDLDRTQTRSLSSKDAAREILRLVRSAEKLGLDALLSPRVAARFLESYTAGDRALRSGLRTALSREAKRIERHRIGWRIARALQRPGRRVLASALCAVALGCSAEADPNAIEAEGGRRRTSLLATGDTGRSRFLPALFEGQRSVARALVEEHRARPVDGLVLLGDNFYPRGLEREALVSRIESNLARPYCYFLELAGKNSDALRKACPLADRERRPVPIYAVLGNHDLEGPESADLQRNAVPEYISNWRMSADLAAVFELPHGISLILFESEPAIEDPAAIRRALIDALRGARGPWRILATHRPIATDDNGGKPLGGYPIWVRDAIAESGRAVQLVLAGHHHNLQAFALETPSRLLQIGAGSGSRAEPPLGTTLPESRFGEVALGFARVDLIAADEGHEGERPDYLSVGLYRTPAWPLFSSLIAPVERARFHVDASGRTTRVDAEGHRAHSQRHDSTHPRTH